MDVLINRSARAAATAALISVFSGGTLYAGPLQFGVVGSPIDLSANVQEAILPGGTLFHDSNPLFGTEPDPKQSAELLHLSEKGVNGSKRSTSISNAFASSLAESNGNGGVGVSRLIFGSPNDPDESVVRQLVAQSLWTQTFVYNGSPTVDIKLHLHIPALQVQLLGVPPNRDNPSFTETAEATAKVDTVITHADGSFSHGGSFEFGLREFETQIPDSMGTLLNFADVDFIGTDGQLFDSFVCNFVAACNIGSVSTDVDLGVLHTGDTLAYIYTLTAQGTTHGFERGYDAFLGDPFGGEAFTDNLSVTVALADVPEPSTPAPTDVPEPSTCAVVLAGLAGLALWRKLRNERARVSSAGLPPQPTLPTWERAR
jgi:PEP-CTERM motif